MACSRVRLPRHSRRSSSNGRSQHTVRTISIASGGVGGAFLMWDVLAHGLKPLWVGAESSDGGYAQVRLRPDN